MIYLTINLVRQRKFSTEQHRRVFYCFSSVQFKNKKSISSPRCLAQGRQSYSVHQDHMHDGDTWKIKTYLVFIVNAHLTMRVKTKG